MTDQPTTTARCPSPLRRANGFTLLELLVTVFVLGVLLSVAVPGFFDTVRNSRATANTNELVTALSIARSEAVRRGARVTLCGTADGATCNGSWNQQWVVFVDGAATDTASPSGITAANTLREWGAPSGDTTIAMQRIDGSAATVHWVRFLPRGDVRTHNNVSPVVFNVEIGGCSGTQGRDIELNAVGRTTVERVAC